MIIIYMTNNFSKFGKKLFSLVGRTQNPPTNTLYSNPFTLAKSKCPTNTSKAHCYISLPFISESWPDMKAYL